MKIICLLPFLFLSVLGAPIITYDQRQDGEVNVRADLKNFVVIALVPKIDNAGSLLVNALSKTVESRKDLKNFIRRRQNIEPDVLVDDLDLKVEEPFVEPKTPYRVDISHAKSSLSKLYPIEFKSEVLKPQGKSDLGENPVPDVVPVKDNKYVIITEEDGKKEIEIIDVPA